MKQRTKSKAGCEGVALIVALFAVMILTALAVTFASVARTAVLLAGNRRAMLQAFYAAQSGLNYCRPVLAADDPGVDSAAEQWAQVQDNPPAFDIPGFTVNVVIEDESARLDINTATKDMLTALPEMTEEAADGILDWRDANEEPRPLGAESDYYLGLPAPYEAGDGPFETIDQLRLVRGVDQALFEGDGTEANPGLRNLVTVRSGERNLDRRLGRRVNVRTAPAAQVAAAIGNLTRDQIAAIARQQGRLRSLGDVVGMTIPRVSWQRLARALDRLTVDSGAFVEGTVNLNTASAPVLQAIGLSASEAQAVVERRAAAPFTDKGQLLEVGVSRARMAAVADRVATKSCVFRVRAVAQAEERPLRAGVFALLDRSGGAPRLILWHEDAGLASAPQEQ